MALVVTLCLTACVTAASAVFTKPNVAPEQVTKDRYECKVESDLRAQGNLLLAGIYWQQCLESRGYVRTK